MVRNVHPEGEHFIRAWRKKLGLHRAFSRRTSRVGMSFAVHGFASPSFRVVGGGEAGVLSHSGHAWRRGVKSAFLKAIRGRDFQAYLRVHVKEAAHG